ncbi:uncharacterized protein LOC119607140 [Lucilia sericata]|uniref:uncharacterized protein LOC119607140 n=1 Tax=Lucilia sericata TaxID=13632 RepID=UPI0018A82259|nr:uncharacterized protein LOC119607140 [Lucilia sericata]XP_037816861.1 uncharacterized protein LOC119607140 [Lucilia sericata]
MFVIFPADELILMTYGAAIPRISPRPTLDCLREPQVPIVIPARSLPPPSSSSLATLPAPAPSTTASAPATTSSSFFARFRGDQQQQQQQLQQLQQQQEQLSLNIPDEEIEQYPVYTPEPLAHRLLHSTYERPVLPTILERPSPTPSPTPIPYTTPTPPLTPTRRSSKTSLKRSTPVLRRPEAQLATPPQLLTPMYNDLNMRSSQQHQQQPTSSSRPTLERSTALRESTPLRYNEDPGMAMGAHLYPPIQYPTGSLEHPSRESSPSILVEPPETDPTKPRLGPGWGRPMSPMELPPEPSTSQKSPSSKSRMLRPKLHIPLGRLGRSSSSDHKESHRLREDLELQVENPIFNTENLRQLNFDAFFDSGEPVYKLQPKTPATAPMDGSMGATLPPLDNYAGVYDSPRKNRNTSSSGGLFARSPKEDKLLSSRSKSTEQYDPIREGRASSVGPAAGSASVASGGSGGGGGGGSTSGGGGVPQKDFLGKSSSGPKSRNFFGWRGPRGGSLSPQSSMASYNGVLKDYGHSSLNEAFKSQNNVNFKLIKTVSDFTETLSHLYEEHATALQALVTNFRKKNAELRKERPACHLSIFQAWETFLQEVETDSQASNDVANVLYRQVSRPMLDKSFHRKVQSRKIFTHRESFETIIAKTEEKLSKCRLDYKQCYMSHRQNPTQHSLTEYIDAHNAYVQQLHATNAMLETYNCETVPQLMQELEEIHNDLCSIIADSIQQGADVICNKASDQAKRYNSLTTQCTTISPVQDLTNFVRILPPITAQLQKAPKRPFVPPQPAAGEQDDNGEYNEITPILRNELVFDRHSSVSLRLALESLKREALDLEMQIRQLQDAIDVLNRNQIRGIEGQLYNKVNETQEDLLMNKFDLRAKQLHLAAIRAQVSKHFSYK